MKGWIDSFSEDVIVLKKVLGEPRVSREARLLAAAALSYVVTRLDLIPDWEESCGMIDDAMIIRVAMALATEGGIGDLDADGMGQVARLANEAEIVQEFLGPDLYGRLKRYTRELINQSVRGRSPNVVVDDEKERAHLYDEIGDELRNLAHTSMPDPGQVERTIKSYLKEKLKQ